MRRVAAAALVAAVIAVGCGGDDSEKAERSPQSTEAEETTTTSDVHPCDELAAAVEAGETEGLDLNACPGMQSFRSGWWEATGDAVEWLDLAEALEPICGDSDARVCVEARQAILDAAPTDEELAIDRYIASLASAGILDDAYPNDADPETGGPEHCESWRIGRPADPSLPQKAQTPHELIAAEFDGGAPWAEQFIELTIEFLCPDLRGVLDEVRAGTVPTGPPLTDFASGTVLRVGVDIEPGTYLTTDPGACYWERQDAAGEIIDNYFSGQVLQVEVTIDGSDFAFSSEECGTWRKTG